MKKIKKICYTIQDETLKKYVLEDFLEKIKNLTPIQVSKKNYTYSKFKKKDNPQILKETKDFTSKKKDLSKIQIIEFSMLFIILNYFKIASQKLKNYQY